MESWVSKVDSCLSRVDLKGIKRRPASYLNSGKVFPNGNMLLDSTGTYLNPAGMANTSQDKGFTGRFVVIGTVGKRFAGGGLRKGRPGRYLS